MVAGRWTGPRPVAPSTVCQPTSAPGQRHLHRIRLSPRCAYRIDLPNGAVAIAPSKGQPRALLHFIGGAFAGAAPYLVYQSLIDQIADSGYTVISTPYAVTFQHDACARKLHTAFLDAIKAMQEDRSLTWAAPGDIPVHGIGHSNGALMHAMIASLCSPTNASNVLLSFNNRQVIEAVPVPLTPLQAALQPIRMTGTLQGFAQSAIEQVVDATQTLGRIDEDTIASIRQIVPAISQIGSVLDEVAENENDKGIDFSPTPEENRRLLSTGYNVPRTLLVQFADDGIDQTSVLTTLLQQRYPYGAVAVQVLPGNHLTPTGPSAEWKVTGAFGPGDAVAQAFMVILQRDLRRLAVRVVEWLREEDRDSKII